MSIRISISRWGIVAWPAVLAGVLAVTPAFAQVRTVALVATAAQEAPAPRMGSAPGGVLQWIPLSKDRTGQMLDSLPIPPDFQVRAIGSHGATSIAIIDWHGESYMVQPGTAVPNQEDPAFVVRRIAKESVEVYDPVAKMDCRRSLPPLTGGL